MLIILGAENLFAGLVSLELGIASWGGSHLDFCSAITHFRNP